MQSTEHRAREPGPTEEQLAFLARAGERLSTSLDLRTTLANLARLSVPTLCDYCVIDLLEEDGHLRRVEAIHVDPAKEHLLAGPPSPRESGPWFAEVGPRLLTCGELLLTPSNDGGPGPRSHPFLPATTLGTISSICAPLVASGRALGVLTLATADSGRRYGPADLAIAQDLARRAALAIDNARQHAAEHHAREVAERAAARTSRLQTLTSSLSAALTPAQVADAVLQQGLVAVDARAAVLALRTQDGGLEVTGSLGVSPGRFSRGARLPEDARGPLAEAVRRKQPLWLESEAALAELGPSAELDPEGPDPPRAVACLPLLLEDRAIGAIAFCFREPRALSHEDRSFLLTLARQSSQAIERARLYEATERARAAAELATSRLVALQRMTAALSDTMSRIKVAETIVDHVRDMLPNCKAIVATVSADGAHLDLVRAIGHTRDTLDRYDSTKLAFASPLTDAVRTQAPLFFDDFEAYRARYPHLVSGAVDEPICIAAVPFVVEDRAIGGLSLRFHRSGQRAIEDNAFILHLARTCTQSLERAYLYEAEKKARAEADVERRRLALLAEASAVLAASLDPAAISEALARVAVPTFASYCIVCSLDEDSTPQFVNALHEDPEKEALLRDMRTRYPFGKDHPITEAARTGKAKLSRVIDDSVHRAIAADAEHLELLRHVDTTSSIVVPLIARGHALGVLSFGVCGARSRYGQADLALAEELGQRAALALDNARLFHEAQEASRVKDEFLGVVSHELRTPLNAILGWARMLRTGAVREGNQPRALESIERNAVHQAKLIDDLLDASRITAGKLRLDPSILELGPVVEAAVHSVTPGATNREITLHTFVDPSSVPIFGDPSRLQQVVWNLLSNAIKFTPKGGRIDVRLARAGDEAVLVVTDSGRGIRAELLPHIFERFRQGDGTLTRASGGLGLGLSIVRHLVEAHGGTVRAESDGPDTGAKFTVKLPLAKPRSIPAQGPPADERRAEKRALAGLSILVVDDEPDAREILSEILDLAGANVKTAADAAEALRILSDFVPDVLVSDLAMPGDDGLSLIRKIRSRTPDRIATVPAIALTAYTRPEDRVRALNAGFQMHVPKPVDPTELVVTIASLRTLLA
ncbi:GAF domain-containing protein [Polyangium spumosum]|uniref:histidine kinase n=1 Tax=Polyangium spumosum TaxID=889282 RepID=A0A6N7Q9Q9_9BACT|nr:GAF domain-containing protein [Polyangium spumosum]MRG97621.1 GAF domain-containing protein [Polyangium spumosum]